MRQADVSVFHWINGWSDAYSPFYDFLSEATKSSVVRGMLVVLAIALIAAGPRTRKPALLSLLGFLIANGITDLFKNHLPVERPCVELLPNVVNHGVGFLQSAGTVSAHAANTAAIAVIFTCFLRFWGLIPIVISLFTGLARIYVGVHYPSQVLYGWICGVVVGLGLVWANQTWERWKSKRLTKLREPSNGEAASQSTN